MASTWPFLETERKNNLNNKFGKQYKLIHFQLNSYLRQYLSFWHFEFILKLFVCLKKILFGSIFNFSMFYCIAFFFLSYNLFTVFYQLTTFALIKQLTEHKILSQAVLTPLKSYITYKCQ